MLMSDRGVSHPFIIYTPLVSLYTKSTYVYLAVGWLMRVADTICNIAKLN